MSNCKKYYAVFGVYTSYSFSKLYLVTTREDGTVGFPGGKVDVGDGSDRDTLIWECKEEGVAVGDVSETPFFEHIVDGKLCAWYKIGNFKFLDEYKEKRRGIKPIFVDYTEFSKSKNFIQFCNDIAIEAYNKG